MAIALKQQDEPAAENHQRPALLAAAEAENLVSASGSVGLALTAKALRSPAPGDRTATFGAWGCAATSSMRSGSRGLDRLLGVHAHALP
ncbi:MAG: hypothetical protein KF838_03615 [Phycisphaeraceae bacterium]|nr:MAG: hypothetical protein KF838_03615 [Phycisphaeraceae bacterium]